MLAASPEQNGHKKRDDFAASFGENSVEKNVEERGVSLTESRESDWSLITQGFFSLRGTGQRILAGGDRGRARVLQLIGLNRVELDIFREFRWKILLLVDRVHRAYVHTRHAINAIITVNDHLVLQFVETGDRAHLHTVGELASGAFVGHDVGHGIGRLRVG
jgi:hypothetical protein